jgi:hypothetical protein
MATSGRESTGFEKELHICSGFDDYPSAKFATLPGAVASRGACFGKLASVQGDTAKKRKRGRRSA